MKDLDPTKVLALLVTHLALAVLGAAAQAQATVPEQAAPAGRVETRNLFVSSAGRHVRHLVFMPSAYEAPGPRRWPLIVGLHGTAGRPEQVMDFQRLRELAERYGYMIVCPHSSGVGEAHQRYVLEVLDHTMEHYLVDPNRVYLLGFSRGGAGVWGLGAAHPERWAALAPISPATGADPAPLEQLREVPVVVVLGDQDTAVSVRSIRRWVRRMDELDMEHRFVELPGMGHDLRNVNFLPLVFSFFERAGSAVRGSAEGPASPAGPPRRPARRVQ